MIVQPKVRGFICTTAHPEGLKKFLEEDIAFIKSKGKINAGKTVLVIGASMGYGLAARCVAAFGGGADTLGVIFDRPAQGQRTASAGWYNTAAAAALAEKEGLYFKTVNGDAFSRDIKKKVIDILRADSKKVDCIIYSLAAPRRTMPDGSAVSSVLKTVGRAYTQKTIDLRTKEVGEITVEPATDEEIDATVKVMGGEDWQDWTLLLKKEGLLSERAVSVAFSYIGPSLTYPIYRDGSIGRAKEDLYRRAELMRGQGINALVSVNKALVTQSSSAIPVVPLYISILFKVMKENSVHENTVAQMQRLFGDKRLCDNPKVDENTLIRLDDLELDDKIQKKVAELWKQAGDKPLDEIADMAGYDSDFLRLFGFDCEGVDYSADVETETGIKGLEE